MKIALYLGSEGSLLQRMTNPRENSENSLQKPGSPTCKNMHDAHGLTACETAHAVDSDYTICPHSGIDATSDRGV